MINSVDVVVGLAWGDEAKGKVASQLASTKRDDGTPYYNFVARWNGGSNAGHTIYINDNCYKTHIVPCGVLHGIKSVIGPNCVLHPQSFYEELDELSDAGFDMSLVKVAPNCHIVSNEHISFDRENLALKLGTTSSGIAPCYASKAARTGVLAQDALEHDFIWDGKLSGNVLCEGAQGVWLDINHGNYPYVTSSETLPYSSCSLGFPTQVISNIYGAAKLYDTRSGEDSMFPPSLLEDPTLRKIADVGKEYGVTTGRRRKVNWLNLNMLIDAARLSGATNIVVNKCDVIREVGVFKLHYNGEELTFPLIEEMTKFVEDKLHSHCFFLNKVSFSHSPYEI